MIKESRTHNNVKPQLRRNFPIENSLLFTIFNSQRNNPTGFTVPDGYTKPLWSIKNIKMMRYITIAISFLVLVSCKHETNKSQAQELINEKYFLDLGGELQYVEITGTDRNNPILLFIHGGPAWPQTPQIRYYNAEIAEKYTLVVWEQRGAGKSYEKNPEPSNLSLEQIVKDGHQLTEWLKEKYNQNKIYLAGYSWGSLVGVNMVKDKPENYFAYIGISQVINMYKGMEISQKWLMEQALQANDFASIRSIDSLANGSFYEDNLDRFFKQWLLLNKYNGAVFDNESEKETEKAMSYYEDYKNYNWFEVWEYSSKKLQGDMFETDIEKINTMEVPVFLIQGKYDWNIPSVLAKEWFDELNAPKKKIYWFEKSGHGPLEEEPKKFNETIIGIIEEVN